MTAQRHEARPNSQTGMKATVESMLAKGMSPSAIMQATGKSRSYVAALIGYQSRYQLYSPTTGGDCEAHLAAIAAANNGMGFPFAVVPASYRVRA